MRKVRSKRRSEVKKNEKRKRRRAASVTPKGINRTRHEKAQLRSPISGQSFGFMYMCPNIPRTLGHCPEEGRKGRDEGSLQPRQQIERPK